MTNSRRHTLKAIVLGSGALAVNKLPATWTRPVVDSVVLPAHAQTSPEVCPRLVNGSPSTLQVQAISGAPDEDLDGIRIIFDGCNDLRMTEADEPSSNDDALLFLDADSAESDVFDVESGPGSNWSLALTTFAIPQSDIPEGSHQITVQRLTGETAGESYDVLFDVAVDDITGGVEMTVSNLRAQVVI